MYRSAAKALLFPRKKTHFQPLLCNLPFNILDCHTFRPSLGHKYRTQFQDLYLQTFKDLLKLPAYSLGIGQCIRVRNIQNMLCSQLLFFQMLDDALYCCRHRPLHQKLVQTCAVLRKLHNRLQLQNGSQGSRYRRQPSSPLQERKILGDQKGFRFSRRLFFAILPALQAL